MSLLDKFEKSINQVNDILNSLISDPDDFMRFEQVPSLISKTEPLVQRKLGSLQEYI